MDTTEEIALIETNPIVTQVKEAAVRAAVGAIVGFTVTVALQHLSRRLEKRGKKDASTAVVDTTATEV